jgi:flagellin
MPLRVNSNLASNNVLRQLNLTTRAVDSGLERLASGLRINRAADDAAGLSVREGLRAELSGLQVNTRNAELANNLLQTAEGSLNEVNSTLIRLRELAVQSSSSTLSDSNRSSLQAEFGHLVSEVDRIAQSTTFNDQVLLTGFGNAVDPASTVVAQSNITGITNVAISGAPSGIFNFVDSVGDSEITLGNGQITQTIAVGTVLDGSTVATGTQVVANFDRIGIQVTLAGANVAEATGSFSDGDLTGTQLVINSGTGGSFQIGPSDAAFNRLEVSIPDLTATGTELNLSTVSVDSLTTARSAITSVDSAITKVSQERGNLGAVQNRLSFNLSSTENSIEQIAAAESVISDADIAREITNLTRSQVLQQGATALLVQSQNLQAASVLRLLGIPAELSGSKA